MSEWLRKLKWMATRRDKEAELRAELEFDLSEEAELREGEGLRSDDARWAARRSWET